MSHWIGIMYLGKLVEIGQAKAICRQPRHPYTATLVAAATPPGRTPPWALPIVGEVPHGLDIPSGCTFHPRCPYMWPTCRTLTPPLATVAAQHQSACHLYTDPTSAAAWPPPLPPATARSDQLQRIDCAHRLCFPRKNMAYHSSTGAADILDESNFGVFDLVSPSGTSELQVSFHQLIHAGRTDWMAARLQTAHGRNG